MSNHNRANSNKSVVLDSDQVRKTGFENYVEADKDALPDFYSACAVQ